MTLMIELPPDVENRLRREADAHGVSEAEYARSLIEAGLGPARPMTGAEAVAYWEREGVLGLFQDKPDSPEFARMLRAQAEKWDW